MKSQVASMMQSQDSEAIEQLELEKVQIGEELKNSLEENTAIRKQEHLLIQYMQTCIIEEEPDQQQPGARLKEASSKKASGQKKALSKKKEVAWSKDGYIQRELFGTVEPKTLDLCERLVERVNLHRQLLLQENVALADQVQHMQQDLEAEQKVKGEIHQEFTKIKQKLVLVKKWEDDAL